MMNNIDQARLRLEAATKRINTYKPQDRVIINRGTIGAPVYYVATVLRNYDGKVHICCDDGYTAAYKPTTSKAGLVGYCKVPASNKRIKPIPIEHLSMWL